MRVEEEEEEEEEDEEEEGTWRRKEGREREVEKTIDSVFPLHPLSCVVC